jgi:hypothetical protein
MIPLLTSDMRCLTVASLDNKVMMEMVDPDRP